MKIGMLLFTVGFIFNFLETWYFGWNITPQSSNEMICDYISVGIMILGFFIIITKIRGKNG